LPSTGAESATSNAVAVEVGETKAAAISQDEEDEEEEDDDEDDETPPCRLTEEDEDEEEDETMPRWFKLPRLATTQSNTSAGVGARLPSHNTSCMRFVDDGPPT
jgi:hypothetical protein